ncbi:hypothetical protein ABTX80_24795 [Streptomyces erythrochromogenes]|uniref:hypothetical protein n=1 Tax=Streptomyces erythrochromogenes TaxID=285574 RepID=UPI00331E76EA
MSSSWHEERRADKAAEARTAREDKEHAAKLLRDERRRDREETRAEQAQARRDRAARKQARAAKRQRDLTPTNVYSKGTLALVGFSAAASLPAQIIHFVSLHWMLFPIGPALEGLAWVMAAGVAYADEKKLPAWVRWLLRGLTLTAASYSAYVNHTYGQSLTHDGLTAEDANTVAMGLAAVSLIGPVVFEIRQWVRTLTAATANPKRAEEKARARHNKQQRKDHRRVARVADRLVSARPYGELNFEDAFALAWEIENGTRELGMAPDLHGRRHASRKDYAQALDEANGSPLSIRGRLLEVLHTPRQAPPADPVKPQRVTQIPPSAEGGVKPPRKRPVPPLRKKGDSVPFHPVVGAVAADTARRSAVTATVNGHHH